MSCTGGSGDDRDDEYNDGEGDEEVDFVKNVECLRELDNTQALLPYLDSHCSDHE